MDGVAALGVVDEAEVFAGFFDGDHIHEASGVGGIGADLAVNLNESLHENSIGLAAIEGIFEAVSEKDDQGQRVAELMRAGGGFRSIGT